MKNRLGELRRRAQLSQEELANLLKVSRQTVNSVENGRYNPSITLAIRMARLFRLNVEDIFIYEEGK